jgi:DNA-binding MarR family transcriptional regulator
MRASLMAAERKKRTMGDRVAEPRRADVAPSARAEGEREPASQLSGELGLLVARMRRIVLTGAQARLSAMGESLPAWQILSRLVREGAHSQRDLAETTAQNPAGISRLVDDLEARGEVERRRDTVDRRKLQVAVTPAGRRRYDEIYPRIVESIDEAVAVLSLAERRTLRALLRKVVDAAEPASAARRRGA